MMLGKQDKVLNIGNLDTVRAVTDVRDIANAFYLVMINPATSGNIYNVCGGEPLKMRYYTETLLKLSKLTDVKQEISKKLWRPIDIQYQDGDPSKLMKDVGWKPEYTIDTTLNDLLQYWLNKLQ
jgi:GDP-4-dehydro-6-deoxy-D-mannose reductase